MDIAKVTGFKIEDLRNILLNSKFDGDNDNFLEKEFFQGNNFRKIKKKLFIEIANARILEIAEIMLFKNINLKSFLKNQVPIFLNIKDIINQKCFESSYKLFFADQHNYELSFFKNENFEILYENANNVVQYGWNKEAVPLYMKKNHLFQRSLISSIKLIVIFRNISCFKSKQ